MAAKSSGVGKAKDIVTLETVEFESLLSRMLDISNKISRRAYEIFENECPVSGHDVENWLRAEREILHPIHVMVVESGQAVEVIAEVPGFGDGQLKVSLQPRHLIISGKKEVAGKELAGKIVHADECPPEIFRMITLPAEVKAAKTSVTLKDGILSLVLPKAEKVKSIRQTRAA